MPERSHLDELCAKRNKILGFQFEILVRDLSLMGRLTICDEVKSLLSESQQMRGRSSVRCS